MTKYKHYNIKIMTTKNFNAKKMLMSAVAAVVFSFVFTTSANANTTPQEQKQRANLEIRVKARPNGDSQKKQENTDVVSKIIQKFGIRVK